jgi:hypothetical protein
VALTLATPFLRDEDLDRVEQVVDLLAGPGFELVVNDWGLADLARERRWEVPLSLGRLLVKGSAGVPCRETPGDLNGYLTSGSLDAPSFIRFAREQGIVRIEADHLAPPSKGFASAGLPVSFHHPDGLVTIAGRCPWRFDGTRWAAGPCARPCGEGEFVLRRDEDGLELTVRGCAQLLRREGIPEAPSDRGIDRLVDHLPAGGGR